jgi:hypothetical protein
LIDFRNNSRAVQQSDLRHSFIWIKHVFFPSLYPYHQDTNVIESWISLKHLRFHNKKNARKETKIVSTWQNVSKTSQKVVTCEWCEATEKDRKFTRSADSRHVCVVLWSSQLQVNKLLIVSSPLSFHLKRPSRAARFVERI